ncbi:DUF1810 domain-containing protein [Acidiphilium sp. AL]|uniref:DUF1810 domain-containing protein n=1 Tax=Acidiphilium iwatense TaxID=768198 RepID=A0ABS9DVJ4_9PROT|nr:MULTISPECIES: DUF1810 domain-containing protein [Acidiphilium]MCF3946761.1 DUF1810 domain-containing protein [Acidiphilium iwatense]MCU4158730.1 DUF1810 domain-containing protein [Acidiphilium sp. AL]
MADSDPFDLGRFLRVQESVFGAVLAELQAGRKRTHWMWFIFPQLRGLGRSPAAEYYGLSSLDEARAYLAHALLGPRLDHCARIVLMAEEHSLHAIFGSPDDMKFHSSMTLFALAAADEQNPYRQNLVRWFGGGMDGQTLGLLRRTDHPR